MTRGTHLQGLALATAGVVVLSPDSLLIRLVGADAWTLSLWRGLLLALTLGAAQVASHGTGAVARFRRLGARGGFAGLLSGLSTICFVGAVTHTTVANVFIISGAIPLIAALLGRAFLNEPVPLRTWLAIGGALAGIGLAVGGALEGPRLGDLFAAGTVLFMAGYLTTVRAAGDVDMTPCIAVSGLIAAGVALPFAQPFSVPSGGVPWLLLLCIVVIPVSFSLITMAPRYLPAHEVALIGLLEMILGPMLVWWVLGEDPGHAALAGGAIVLVVLAGHSATSVRAEPKGGPGR